MPTIDDDPLADVLAADTRYARQAYHFLNEAVSYTVFMLGLDHPDVEDRHVSGQQLLEGIRRLALERFGYLARVVFESWGVRSTEDWGEVVFNMVESQLMRTTERDSRKDFANGYDFAETFESAYFRDRLYVDLTEVYEATSTLSEASIQEVRERIEQAKADASQSFEDLANGDDHEQQHHHRDEDDDDTEEDHDDDQDEDDDDDTDGDTLNDDNGNRGDSNG